MVHIAKAIKETIEKTTLDELKDFVKIVDKSAAWYIVSDYCFDDETKVSDTVTFSLILNHDKLANLKEGIHALQPCDIKSTSEVREGFLKYIVSPVIYNFTFVLNKADKFLSNSLPNNEIEHFIEHINDDIQNWAIDNPIASKYIKEFKKRITLFREQKRSKAFSWKLMRKIFIISSIASVIIYEISKLDKPLAIKWVSDRDGIVEKFDSIAIDLAFACYVYLLADFGAISVVDLTFMPNILFVTSKNGIEDNYDELVRIPDFIAGTMASVNKTDYDFNHSKYYPIFYGTIVNAKNHSVIAIDDKNQDIYTRRMKYNALDLTDKKKWESIAGLISDNVLSKQINKVLDESDFGVYLVHKDDILACDFTGIRDVISRLSRNKKALLTNRGSLEILIDGFDDDPREAYDIPEIRNWFSESIKAGIPWFYFLGRHYNGMGLCVLLFACCDIVMKHKKDVMAYVEFTNPEEIASWFLQNYHNLNQFIESNNIPEEYNKEMSLQARTIVEDVFKREHEGSALESGFFRI
jgi:hypothetical protein